MLNVQIESSLHDQVKKLASLASISQANLVQFILDGYFNGSTAAELLKNIGSIGND